MCLCVCVVKFLFQFPPATIPVSQVQAVPVSASSSAPVFPPVVRDDTSGVDIEVLCGNCFLVRRLLPMKDQVALFQYIEDRDQTPWDSLPTAMVPAPKTLMFGKDQPVLRFEAAGEPSAIRDMVERASQLVERNRLHLIGQDEDNARNINFRKYKAFTMAAIKYKAPDGKFPPHVDHCDGSYVFLMSLGCTANFMVKGPDMDSKHNFKFRSGDLLVFDSSTKAAILHGVTSIDDLDDSCPKALANAFPVLQNHRYGVQCRVNF